MSRILIRTLAFILTTGCFFTLAVASSPFSGCASHLSFAANSSDDATLNKLQSTRRLLESKLGIHRDPFVWASNVDAGVRIWSRLCESFPLLIDVSEAVYVAHEKGRDVPEALEEGTLKEAEALLEKISDRDAMAGAVKALLKLEEIRVRSLPPPKEKEEKRESKQEDKKEEKQKGKEPQKKGPPNPQYPEPMQVYQAKNKDSESEGGGNEERVPIATVNKGGVSYFRMAAFQVVDPLTNRWAQTAVTNPSQLQVTQTSAYSVKVYPYAEKGQVLPLLVPQGFVPVTFSDAHSRVTQDETGNFFFQTQLDTLEVPLLPQGMANRPLSPPEKDLYTAPSQILLSAWPKALQGAVEQLEAARDEGKFSGVDGDVKLAQVLGSYIANHFKYRVDKNGEESAVTLVNKGAFQCDTAATLLTTLLRNEFKIPCRPVSGFRGMRRVGEPDASHVISPAQAHAWVEVADASGNWHGVDPAPKKKDRKTKQDSADDDFRGIESEKQESENQNAEKGDKKESPSASGAGKEVGGDPTPGTMDGTQKDNSGGSEKTLEELIAEVEALQKKKNEERAQSEKSKGKQAGKQSGQEPNKTEEDTTDNAHEIGNKQAPDDQLRKIEGRNPFIRRLLTRMVSWALDQRLGTKTKLQRLNQLKAILGNDSENHFPSLLRLKTVLSQTNSLFTGDKPPFDKWLESLFLERKSLNSISDEIVHVQRQIEFTLTFLDPEERAPLERILRELLQVRRALGQIRHKDSEAIRIALELHGNLPGNISRKIISDQFGISGHLGDDIGTLSLSKAISEGKLNDYRLSSILGPHTDFVVDPIPKPRQGERRTWDHSLNRRSRPDILLTSDPRYRSRIRLYEHLTDKEALARGEMGVLINRRRVPYIAGTQDSEPEKATVILLDTSGSMAGNNAYFQSMYVGALVDRALSDLGPDGKTRHRVYVVPFDTDTHHEVEVNSTKEAIDFVKNVRTKTGNTCKRTDIQRALLRAAEMLRVANETGDRVFSRATVVLCSDGQSNVDAPTIKKAFDSVGNKTDILMAFVAIGSTNPKLVELTSKNLGSEKSMYIEWNGSDIDRVISDSHALAKPINDFWTNYSWNNLPAEVPRAFAALERALGVYRAQSSVLDAQKNSFRGNTLALQKKSEVPVINRPEKRRGSHYGKLSAFRRFLTEIGSRIGAEDRARLLDEVFIQWPRLVSESMNALDHQELAALDFIFKWPQTGVAGEQAP